MAGRRNPRPRLSVTDGTNSAEIARLQEQVKALYRLLDEREKQLNIAFSASQKAVDTALAAQQQVNATQNEFRGALRDQSGTFATKGEVALHVDRLLERVTALEKGDASQMGRSKGITAAQMFIAALIPIVISLVALLWSIART